tara:strand:- start:322 stop:780 length:459 start_codon:yes stop_codon:yes gene_type:complete
MATTKATELHQLSGTLTVDANGHVTLTGNVNAASFIKGGKPLLDSSLATSLIDSAYVLARAPAQTIPTLGGDFVDSAFVTAQINSLIDGAPGALNTLNELAAALNDDASFNTTVTNSIASKLDSALTVQLIDSSYVQARGDGDGLAFAIALG